MPEIVVARAQIAPGAIASRPVSEQGLAELPEESTVRTPAGQVLLAYHRLWPSGHPELESLRALLNRTDFQDIQMLNGLLVRRRAFGRWPRAMPREDWCHSAVLDRELPELSDALARVGGLCEQRYAAISPVTFAHHCLTAERVLPEWRLPGLRCFTGGVANCDSAIKYHKDRGNFAGTFSAMPVITSGMAGGYLCVPELGVYVRAADGMCVWFDGQSLWHGVTPIRRTQRGGHRFTVVYYSASKLWQCLPPALELERARSRRADRELRRAVQ